jgi:glycyl-tRNA synthetase alpha subunit
LVVASAPMIRRKLARHIARLPVLAAFDLCLKCSHLFNILDARGAISVTERVGVIARIRNLAVGVAKAYVDQQKAEAEVSNPILSPKEGDEDGAPEQLAATRT